MEETNLKQDLTQEETQQRLKELKRRMLTMEWDIKRNQINPAMRQKYEDLKKEVDSLQTTVLE